jgi:hypothetical protein
MQNNAMRRIKIATGNFFLPFRAVLPEKPAIFACEWLPVKALPVRLPV